ncbi:hypothetical protein ACH5RR_004860 [Cinchona calisaya]|uniref:DUF4378 domain-containing protein n=1 Tax=Cinchona calisaya TaxID=153742 RepID=A0ABD3AYT2_9GENT
MGKNMPQQEPSITLEHNSNPGWMKGIFHHFNHHKWHHLRKKLPHKRNSGAKFTNAVEDSGNNLNTTNAWEVQDILEAETAKSSVHAKSTDSGSGQKSSMKSRIKALITEEVYRRRGRHRRSSSYPTRMPSEKKPSINHRDVSSIDPCAETGFGNDPLDHQDSLHHSSVSILLDPLLPQVCGDSLTRNRSCHLCAAMLTKKYLRQSEVNEHGKQPVKDHTLLQNKLIYAIEPSKVASLQESKLFLDALDLLNIRKELFLKVLQDPDSSLSHHLHCQKASSLRLGLTKSVSFPTPGFPGRKAPASNSPECGSCTEGESKSQVDEDISSNALAFEDLDQNLAIKTGKCAEDGDALASLGSPKELKNHQVNKLILKRFKNLREKIKHAIKESKKEKQRIVMDAVLHKIPYGYPKDLKEENGIRKDAVTQKWNKYSSGNDQFSASSKIGQHGIRRTSSFHESLIGYNRLLELCFNEEANSQTSNRSKLKSTGTRSPLGSSPICLERILSLPDLRSYSFSRIERSAATNSLETPIRPLLGGSLSTENISVCEQKPAALESQIQLVEPPENDSPENILEVGDSLTDLVGSKRRESISEHDDIIEPTTEFRHDSKFEEDAIPNKDLDLAQEDLNSKEEDSLLNLQHDLNMDSPSLHESSININKVEALIKQSYNDLLHVHVDMKKKAEFNYVKDVLELSGFCGTEFLGKWHSEEQPVDPLVFEEVEGCLLAQPDCSGNEEGGSCNHLLLFDLINEVLLEIYGRTFSYWPMPLTCRSHVHPMPVGYHVLEDVWASINWYLRRMPEVDQSLDDAVSRDLSKSDGWMNIQFEAECVGIELEDLLFDDLLDELVFT